MNSGRWYWLDEYMLIFYLDIDLLWLNKYDIFKVVLRNGMKNDKL